MSSRTYDYVVTVSNAANFISGTTVLGLDSGSLGDIVHISNNDLKIRMGDFNDEFTVGEVLASRVASLYTVNSFIDYSSAVDGISNTFAIPISNAVPDSIVVYINSYPAPRDSFVINSNNTIQFKPVFELSDNSTTEYDYVVYPSPSDVSSLLVQVVVGDSNSASFVASNLTEYSVTAASNIVSVSPSPYIAEKNNIQQAPLVKLYTLYYPGEWYYPNKAGNPSGSGDGFPWPYKFPLRYAEIAGDTYSDLNYSIAFDNIEYKVTALESSDISIDGTGKIGEISFSISNFDSYIGEILEDKNIAGFNASNSAIAAVNGELVTNIDPRTVSGGDFYNPSIAAERGNNAAWDYSSTIAHGDVWIPFIKDSRDLLNGVLEVKYTYANFLDYWPEYSTVRNSTSNSATVYNTSPYRLGDIVTANTNLNTSTISKIENNTIYFNNDNLSNLVVGSKLFIVNEQADPAASVTYSFVITSLEELSDLKAVLSATSWLQYLKNSIPRKKFFRNYCIFQYKGEECKYPSSGTGPIKGSIPSISANGFFTINNETTLDPNKDLCAKTKTACKLRNNLVNFGGFPGA